MAAVLRLRRRKGGTEMWGMLGRESSTVKLKITLFLSECLEFREFLRGMYNKPILYAYLSEEPLLKKFHTFVWS